MKKCLKCGATFSDETNFCSNCGEKLVSANFCPQCGKEVSEGSRFCPNCGANLGVAKEVKPEPKEEPAPAPVKEEVKEEVKPAPEAKASKEEGRVKALKIVNIIVAAVSLLAALFFMIGIFGDVYRVYSDTMGYDQSIGLKYFFHDGPDALNKLRQIEFQRSDYVSYMALSFGFECFLYFGGMVACLILMIFGIIKNIKALTKKTAPNLSLLFAAGASMLPIILLYRVKFNGESAVPGYTIISELGWGANLIVSGLSILLACSVASNIFNSIYRKKNLVPTIIRSAVALVIFILLFNAFGPMTKITFDDGGGVTYKISMNGYAYAESGLQVYSYNSSASYAYYSIFLEGLFSLLFSIAGLTVLFFAYKGSLKGSKVSPIVLSSLSVMFLIIASSLSQATTILYMTTSMGSSILNYMTVTWGASSIAGIVLILVLVVPGTIVANALSSKKAA